MEKFEKLIEEYDYDSLDEKDQQYLDKIGYEIKDIVAVIDFNDDKFYTPNNEYDMNEFDNEFIDFFKEFTKFENKEVKRLPLTQEVLDASDELLDSNVIPVYERPKKEEYTGTREQLRLAFHYEMTLLARLEDKVVISKDKLLHKIETIGTRQGIEVSEEEMVEKYGTKEAKREQKLDDAFTTIASVGVLSGAVLSESDEPVFESDEPVFEMDEPVFEMDEPAFGMEDEGFEMGMF